MKRKTRYLFHLFLCLMLLALSLPCTVTAASERRTALVIGNSAYSAGSLKNPANDAAAMAAILMELGFTVTLKKNAKQQEMDESIREFGMQLKRTRGVGLFYYAGHGMQIGGVNYLLPVNARIEKESDARFQSVSADHVLAEMENAENGLNIVILDACRDNPYSRSFRNASRGLAIVSNAPSGTFISYSTGANQVARDGEGKYSPYTRALLENMVKPGLTINKVFMNVRSEVKKETGQIPWELSSLEGDFYFVPGPPEKSSVTIPSGKAIVGRDKSSVSTAAAADDLDDENRKLEAEHRLLLEERALFAKKKKALEEKRQQIAEERERFLTEQKAERLAAEKRLPAEETTTLAMAKRPSPPEDARIFTSPTLGAKFVLIPAGTFMMGSPSDETGRELYNTWEFGWGKETQHPVTISKPFYMQATEVTQGQWQKVMGNNPSGFKNCGENCPVESVSWNDVQEFIRKLNQTEGTDKYRLPTEAQWEYSARAGTTTRFYTEDSDEALSRAAWYDYNSGGKSHPVAQKTPNAWGLYDMHGNVWEWVQDWNGNYPAGSVTDPEGPPEGLISFRVYRGGAWPNRASYCRSAEREAFVPSALYTDLGFRLIRTQ